MSHRRRFRRIAALATVLLSALTACATTSGPPQGLNQIDHILVVFLENRSFDNLYGTFPGANGIAQAGAAATQLDKDGKPYVALPPVMDSNKKPAAVDARFPDNLPNKPFDIGQYVPLDQKTGDLVHRFYQEQAQIDGGKMDKFAAYSDAGGLVMGHYDGSKTELWAYAQKYVLADNFFHAAFGGSFLNHFWLVCACTPKYPNPPADLVIQLGPGGMPTKDGPLTADGDAVNTMHSSYQPHSAKITDPQKLLPPQDGVTIGDRLSEKGVSWAWYSGGWNDAIAGKPDERFQFHHQPLAYFKQFGDGTAARKEHLKDETDLMAAIAGNSLPSVAFWKPIGAENEHPGYADLASGDRKVASVLRALEQSPQWASTAVIVTYDENGGFWDHVAPPQIDAWGPGSRVPALIISPFAKRGYVDHTQYDTTSILKFIELRYGLKPLATRDAAANDLTNAFSF